MATWLESQRIGVLVMVRQILDAYAETFPERRQLEDLTGIFVARAAQPLSACPSVHLPLLTSLVAGADRAVGTNLAAATAIIELALDLVTRPPSADALEFWSEPEPQNVPVIGSILLHKAVPFALKRLPVHADRVAHLTKEVRDRVSVLAPHVAIGDRRILRSLVYSTHEQPPTGSLAERCALYAKLGGIAAGATSEDLMGYAEMGRFYGSALEIAGALCDAIRDHQSTVRPAGGVSSKSSIEGFRDDAFSALGRTSAGGPALPLLKALIEESTQAGFIGSPPRGSV